MRVCIEIINKYGSFKSTILELGENEYNELILNSKGFYKTGAGFEMFLPNGFIVLPPSILTESLLIINIVE